MFTNQPRAVAINTRAKPESFRARELAASLTVKDIHKSMTWYTDVLGFTVDEQHEREGTLRAVSIKAGDVRLVLSQDDGAKGDRVKGEGFSLQFTTAQSVDEVAARIKANGGTLSMEPTDMHFGARVFRLQDPDGFTLVISSERKR